MNIKEAAQKYAEYTIANRRYIHMHPEVGFEEFNTAKRVREELTAMGIPFEIMAETGTIATITGKNPGKTILLRADMDALKVQEENDFDYCSKNPGVMHACGHDSHTAMLLTAGRILKDMEDELCGTVKLCFQPSEENGQGAKQMIKGDLLKDVEACFSCHVWSDVKSGFVAVNHGALMASANRFDITVKGKASHGSAPHQGMDAITTASEIVSALQSIVSREIDPQEPAVITIGSFHSGTSWNIISDTATLVGTTRCFSNEVNDQLPEAMERVVKNICAAHRCEGEFVYTPIVGPTVNDDKLATLAEGSVRKIFGENAVCTMKPTTGGEDFSIYTKDIPGVLCMIGIYNPEIDGVYANHHGKFKVDEAEMVKGAGLMAQMAVDYLNAEA